MFLLVVVYRTRRSSNLITFNPDTYYLYDALHDVTLYTEIQRSYTTRLNNVSWPGTEERDRKAPETPRSIPVTSNHVSTSPPSGHSSREPKIPFFHYLDDRTLFLRKHTQTETPASISKANNHGLFPRRDANVSHPQPNRLYISPFSPAPPTTPY